MGIIQSTQFIFKTCYTNGPTSAWPFAFKTAIELCGQLISGEICTSRRVTTPWAGAPSELRRKLLRSIAIAQAMAPPDNRICSASTILTGHQDTVKHRSAADVRPTCGKFGIAAELDGVPALAAKYCRFARTTASGQLRIFIRTLHNNQLAYTDLGTSRVRRSASPAPPPRWDHIHLPGVGDPLAPATTMHGRRVAAIRDRDYFCD